MSQNSPILIGQYFAHESFFHRLDARAKIIAAFALLALIMLTDLLPVYFATIILLGAALYGSGLSTSEITRCLKPLIGLVVITILFHLIFKSGDEPYLINIGFIKISRSVAYYALFYSARMILFVLVSFTLMAVTSPSAITDGFAQLIRPLRKLRIPVERISLVMFIAMRFIPILYAEYNSIKDAQILRGATFDGPILRRIKSHAAILIPLLFAAIRKADDLAIAMAVRGYRDVSEQKLERTYYSQSSFGFKEYLFLVVLLLTISGVIYAGRSLG